MLDIRSPVILAAAPAGLLLAAVGWLVLGGPGHALAAIEIEEARLASMSPAPAEAGGREAGALAAAVGSPAFAALARAQVRLDGVARSPGRSSALLSINGGASQWVLVGTTIGGVTLNQISSNRAVIETAEGTLDLGLGETTGSGPDEPPSSPTLNDAAPRGRGLEPASAPGM